MQRRWNAEWHELHRRHGRVTRREFRRRAADQLVDHLRPHVPADSSASRSGAGASATTPADLHRIRDVNLARRRNFASRREPQRELATGRVTRCDDAVEIERILRREVANVVGAMRDVEKRPRPSAAFVTDSTILETPDRVSTVRQRLLDRSGVRDVVRRQPTSSVNEDHDGMQPGRFRQPEIAELLRAGSVLNALVRRSGGERADFRALNETLSARAPAASTATRAQNTTPAIRRAANGERRSGGGRSAH